MNQTVVKRFHRVFVDTNGRPRPEVVPDIPALRNTSREPPALTSALRGQAARARRYATSPIELARNEAAQLEEEIQEELSASRDEGERRRLENTLRLREYDLQEAEREFEQLRAKVQRRSEELGNMEIVVDEEPRLVRLARVEFIPSKEG
ncbi:MAG TPA: hypothetical protein ENN53_05700 [Candidatus Acetothermia bacterium]|nr:hypothetical protein [Candidatus Acetothermia bacterium]